MQYLKKGVYADVKDLHIDFHYLTENYELLFKVPNHINGTLKQVTSLKKLIDKLLPSTGIDPKYNSYYKEPLINTSHYESCMRIESGILLHELNKLSAVYKIKDKFKRKFRKYIFIKSYEDDKVIFSCAQGPSLITSIVEWCVLKNTSLLKIPFDIIPLCCKLLKVFKPSHIEFKISENKVCACCGDFIIHWTLDNTDSSSYMSNLSLFYDKDNVSIIFNRHEFINNCEYAVKSFKYATVLMEKCKSYVPVLDVNYDIMCRGSGITYSVNMVITRDNVIKSSLIHSNLDNVLTFDLKPILKFLKQIKNEKYMRVVLSHVKGNPRILRIESLNYNMRYISTCLGTTKNSH